MNDDKLYFLVFSVRTILFSEEEKFSVETPLFITDDFATAFEFCKENNKVGATYTKKETNELSFRTIYFKSATQNQKGE